MAELLPAEDPPQRLTHSGSVGLRRALE